MEASKQDLLDKLKLITEAYDCQMKDVVKGFILGLNYYYEQDDESRHYIKQEIFKDLVDLQKEGYLGNEIGDISYILL